MNPSKPSALSDNRTEFRTQATLADKVPENRVRLALGSRGVTWLSRETGIAKSTLSDILAGASPTADRAIKIARTLNSTVESLFGDGREPSNHLADVEDADFVNVPRFDLAAIKETDKGNRIETVRFRKDWLNATFRTAAGLWLTALPSDYPARELTEGDIVICSDLLAGGAAPQEDTLCIFTGPGGLFVARYSNRPAAERAELTRSKGERYISAQDMANDDYRTIARIHGQLIARI